MRLGLKHVLHVDELYDAADTLSWVFEAVDNRYTNLKRTYMSFMLASPLIFFILR